MPPRRKLRILHRCGAHAWLSYGISTREVANVCKSGSMPVAERRSNPAPDAHTVPADGIIFFAHLHTRYSSITSTMLRRYLMNVRYVTNVSAQAIRSHLQEAGLHSRNTTEFP